MKKAFTKKVGPLPAWVWVGMVVALALGLYLRRRTTKAKAATGSDQTIQQDGATPVVYPQTQPAAAGSAGGTTGPYPASPTPPSTTPVTPAPNPPLPVPDVPQPIPMPVPNAPEPAPPVAEPAPVATTQAPDTSTQSNQPIIGPAIPWSGISEVSSYPMPQAYTTPSYNYNYNQGTVYGNPGYTQGYSPPATYTQSPPPDQNTAVVIGPPSYNQGMSETSGNPGYTQSYGGGNNAVII